MRITQIQFYELQASAQFEGFKHRGLLNNPAHVYDRFRPQNRLSKQAYHAQEKNIKQIFMRIATDEGYFGQIGPIPPQCGQHIANHFGIILGQNPLATELIWDLLYRSQTTTPGGHFMHALSYLDCALWDLKGRYFDKPVYELLGGPTRTQLPAYAQTKGICHEPESLAEEVQRITAEGWHAIKLFMIHGPGDGEAGMYENEKALRIVCDNTKLPIMIDAWRGWDAFYTRRMMDRIKDYQPLWLEEPLLPELIDQLADIKANSPIPIACGEHHYGRWAHQELINKRACAVLQPDPCWVGGISEIMKVAALSSTAGLQLWPHTCLIHVNAHVIAAMSPALAPMIEWPIYEDLYTETYFLKHQLKHKNGLVSLPQTPGLGMDWDENKIDYLKQVTWIQTEQVHAVS